MFATYKLGTGLVITRLATTCSTNEMNLLFVCHDSHEILNVAER